MSKQAETFDSDTGFVVIAALRYALTRASYAVGLVADYVWRNWNRLSENDKRVVERDIRETLDPSRSLSFGGLDMDRRTWQALLEKIEAKQCRCRGTGKLVRQTDGGDGGIVECEYCARRRKARSSARSEHRPDKAGVEGSNPSEPTKPCKRCQDVGRIPDHHGGWDPCPICQRTKLPPSLAEDIVEAVTDHAEGMEGGSVLYDVTAAINAVERLLETELGAASKRS